MGSTSETDRVAPYPFKPDEYVEYMDYRLNGWIVYLIGGLVALFGFVKAHATIVVTTFPQGGFTMDIVGWGPLPWSLLSVLGVAFAVQGSEYMKRAHRYKQSREAWAFGRTAFLTMTASVILKFIKAAEEADANE